MRPVLLPKHDVDKRKNEEKRQQMEEGMRIATSVDVLRETLANEEAASKVYLAETLRGIQSDIALKHIENEKLDSDIRIKREEWNQLMQPIDKNWMWFVKGEKSRIESQQSDNTKRERELALAIAANIQRERMNEEHSNKLDGEKKTYHQLAVEIRESLAKAKEAVADAKNQAHKLISSANERDSQSRKREAKVIEHEQHLALKEKELAQQTDELATREFKVLAKELEFYSPIKKL